MLRMAVGQWSMEYLSFWWDSCRQDVANLVYIIGLSYTIEYLVVSGLVSNFKRVFKLLAKVPSIFLMGLYHLKKCMEWRWWFICIPSPLHIWVSAHSEEIEMCHVEIFLTRHLYLCRGTFQSFNLPTLRCKFCGGTDRICRFHFWIGSLDAPNVSYQTGNTETLIPMNTAEFLGGSPRHSTTEQSCLLRMHVGAIASCDGIGENNAAFPPFTSIYTTGSIFKSLYSRPPPFFQIGARSCEKKEYHGDSFTALSSQSLNASVGNSSNSDL